MQADKIRRPARNEKAAGSNGAFKHGGRWSTERLWRSDGGVSGGFDGADLATLATFDDGDAHALALSQVTQARPLENRAVHE